MYSTHQVFQGRSLIPYNGAEGSVEPARALVASTPSVAPTLHPNRYHSGTQLSDDDVDCIGNGTRSIMGGGVDNFLECH